MIENIGALIGNSKLDGSIRRRKDSIDTISRSTSIEEAKAKVQKILEEGRAKRRKRKKTSDHRKTKKSSDES